MNVSCSEVLAELFQLDVQDTCKLIEDSLLKVITLFAAEALIIRK